MLLHDARGAEIPERDETQGVVLAGGHKRTARLDSDRWAIIRSCGAEGVANTRAAARTDVVCNIVPIVFAQR